MIQIEPVPSQSISQMLSVLGSDWHSSDYYISPDESLLPDPSQAPFRPEFYGLFLCVQGWMDIKINQNLVRAEPYRFFAVGPDSVVQRGGQSPACKGRVLFFTKEFLLTNIINPYQFEAFHFFTKKQDSCILLTQGDARPLLQLYDILKDKRDESGLEYHFEIIRHLIFSFLYETAIIYQKQGILLPPKYTREADLNYKFQQLLEQNGKHRHDLKFYADALCITPKYLIHTVKKASGKTPGELIDESIVAQAKLLLKDFGQSIASIAEELYFSDQASFSKFFKRHTGFTPLSFRKEG